MQETVADDKDFPLTPALSLQGEGELKDPGPLLRRSSTLTSHDAHV